MKTKTRNWLSFVLFVVIFGGLLCTATFTDFQVSAFLTAKSLSAHTYLTSDTFGAAFEALGSDPVYIGFAFAFSILFWYCYRKKSLSAAPRTIFAVIMAVCAYIANYVMVTDTMDYVQEHVMMIEHSNLTTPGWMLLINVIVACAFWALGLLAVRNFTDAQIEALFKVAIATLAFLILSTVVLHLIKGPVGRIRFRAMNLAEFDAAHPEYKDAYGFSHFARWYEHHGQWISKDEMATIFGTTDALKIKNKGVRALMWIIPVVITGLTAVSRIIVGAHFFSDVLVGGTCAFVCMILCREIIVCKGANVKAMFGK